MKTIVPESWAVPAQIRDRFGDSGGRQRAMIADGHLVLVLHEPPGQNDRQRKARLLWRDPSGAWAWTADGNTSNLLKRHLASFTEKLEQLETKLQDASTAADYFNLLQVAAPLHRTSRNLHVALQSAREAVPDDYDIIVSRDAASDIERAFELLHMDAKNGLDFMVAQKAELQSQRGHEMAVSAHRLNVLAALFFPVTAMSSIFGMNFASGLEPVAGPWLFWLILVAGFISGLLLMLVITNRPLVKEEPTQPAKRLGKSASKIKRKQSKPARQTTSDKLRSIASG